MTEELKNGDNQWLRKQIVEISRRLSAEGFNINSSGNVSVRAQRGQKEGFLVTPSGVDYEAMKPSDLVFVELKKDAAVFWGKLKPSSEWQLHEHIYRKRPDVGSVVHTHSCYATALSCMEEVIPPFHYMIALSNAAKINCAKYATFGSVELAQHAVDALGEQSLACLLSHHGVIACGKDLQKAFALAREVENLAHMWLLIRNSSGSCEMIKSTEMDKILEKFKHYGQTGTNVK